MLPRMLTARCDRSPIGGAEFECMMGGYNPVRRVMLQQQTMRLFSSRELHFVTMRRASKRRLSVCSLAFLAVFLTCAWAQNGAAVPDSIKAPSDQRLVLQGHATGDQIYICQSSSGGDTGFAWVLSAPDARLTDDEGKEVAKHFAGPTWQSTDGSQVKGKVVSQTTPGPDSIPWLLLIATDHNGTGVMSEVRTIQRLNTTGGRAPTSGCDAQHQGEKARVNYTADYYFYAPAK